MPATRSQVAREQGRKFSSVSYADMELDESDLAMPEIKYEVVNHRTVDGTRDTLSNTNAFITLRVSPTMLAQTIPQLKSIAGTKRSFSAVDITIRTPTVKKPRFRKSPVSVKGKVPPGTKRAKAFVVTIHSRLKLRKYAPIAMKQRSNGDNFQFGHNPFKYRDFRPPTPELCQQVLDTLRSYHIQHDKTEIPLTAEVKPLDTVDLSGPVHASHGMTIDSFFKVILSQSTDNDIAMSQHDLLRDQFTYDVDGQQIRGTCPNYWKMRLCTDEQLLAALKSGGLNTKRAEALKVIIDLAIKENCQRQGIRPEDVPTENETGASDFVPGLMSLEFLNELNKEQLMEYLIAIKYVGVKTAACILSFIFKMPVFAVDTHVLHMTRALQWIPEDCDNANQACMFLDTYIPDELKYALHQAFWHHRSDDNKAAYCVRCNHVASDSRKPSTWETAFCPLEAFCKRDIPKLTRNNPSNFNPSKTMVKVTSASQEAARSASSLDKVKPISKAINSITPEKAKELGYVLIKINRDIDFGVSEDKKGKVQWRLMEHAHTEDLITFEDATAQGLIPAKTSRAKTKSPSLEKDQKQVTAFLVKTEIDHDSEKENADPVGKLVVDETTVSITQEIDVVVNDEKMDMNMEVSVSTTSD